MLIAGFEIEIQIRRAGAECQDAALAIDAGDDVFLVVADGAGGMSGGKQAAERVIARCREMAAATPRDTLDNWLLDLDGELFRDPAAGLTTAVVIRLSPSGLAGASVGDSEAWRVASPGSRVERLTVHQRRKPLLGSGAALPVWFSSDALNGDTLLLGSDGLFNYASRGSLLGSLTGRSLADAGERLIEAARMADGALMDDVTAVLCRAA